MPYQNDTSTLADIVSPAYAAGQSMQQNDLENQKQQMANEVYQQQMPALGQQTGLENLFRQAQTSQTNALAQGQGLSNIEKAGTMGTGMAATNAANQTKYTGEQLQRFGQVGQLAGQAAGLMDQVPEAARPAAMASLAQKYGVDPQVLGPLANGDPDSLRNFSQKMIQSSQDYQTKMMQENEATNRATGVAQLTSEGRVQASAQQAQARVTAAQIAQQTRQMSQTFEQAAVAAERHGDHAGAQRYYQAAQNIKQMAAQTTAGLVGFVPTSPGFDQGSGGQVPAQNVGNTPTVPTAQGSTVVGDTEYRQMPDGSWQSRKVQK